jgi:hypothetical protein
LYAQFKGESGLNATVYRSSAERSSGLSLGPPHSTRSTEGFDVELARRDAITHPEAPAKRTTQRHMLCLNVCNIGQGSSIPPTIMKS